VNQGVKLCVIMLFFVKSKIV